LIGYHDVSSVGILIPWWIMVFVAMVMTKKSNPLTTRGSVGLLRNLKYRNLAMMGTKKDLMPAKEMNFNGAVEVPEGMALGE
jgi:hypothetical protein